MSKRLFLSVGLLPLAAMAVALVIPAARGAARGGDEFVVSARGRGDFRSIGAAVDRARSGDVILVRSGIYLEGLVIDKDLTIEADGDVRIDGRDRAAVLVKGAAVTLRNLTLRTRNGERCVNVTDRAEARLVDCDVAGGKHAAVRVVQSGALIRRCIVRDARVEGVNFAQAKGQVEDCCIHENGSHGVRIEGDRSDVTIAGCTIYDHRADSVLAEARDTTTLIDSRLSSPPNNRVAGRDNVVQRVAGCRMEIGPQW
jgi:hypothetical protein